MNGPVINETPKTAPRARRFPAADVDGATEPSSCGGPARYTRRATTATRSGFAAVEELRRLGLDSGSSKATIYSAEAGKI